MLASSLKHSLTLHAYIHAPWQPNPSHGKQNHQQPYLLHPTYPTPNRPNNRVRTKTQVDPCKAVERKPTCLEARAGFGAEIGVRHCLENLFGSVHRCWRGCTHLRGEKARETFFVSISDMVRKCHRIVGGVPASLRKSVGGRMRRGGGWGRGKGVPGGWIHTPQDNISKDILGTLFSSRSGFMLS